MTATKTAVTFDRIGGMIGADVRGIDLHDLPGPEVSETLQRGLAEHGVLFFHNDDGVAVSNDEFRALALLFGPLFTYPYGDPRAKSRSEVGEMDFEDSTKALQTRTNRWHTDGTPQERPPLAALLTPSVVPSAGGDTMWSTMTGLYESLSSRLQGLFDDMEALHSTWAIERNYPSHLRGTIFGEGESHVHPVIPVEPITGKKFLYVNGNYTESLIGMSEWESRHLIEMLDDYVNTPEFHVRLRWRLGTVAVWHERVTQHRAVADFTERRAIRRITVAGEPPKA